VPCALTRPRAKRNALAAVRRCSGDGTPPQRFRFPLWNVRMTIRDRSRLVRETFVPLGAVGRDALLPDGALGVECGEALGGLGSEGSRRDVLSEDAPPKLADLCNRRSRSTPSASPSPLPALVRIRHNRPTRRSIAKPSSIVLSASGSPLGRRRTGRAGKGLGHGALQPLGNHPFDGWRLDVLAKARQRRGLETPLADGRCQNPLGCPARGLHRRVSPRSS